jgi:hypothetical protein
LHDGKAGHYDLDKALFDWDDLRPAQVKPPRRPVKSLKVEFAEIEAYKRVHQGRTPMQQFVFENPEIVENLKAAFRR